MCGIIYFTLCACTLFSHISNIQNFRSQFKNRSCRESWSFSQHSSLNKLSFFSLFTTIFLVFVILSEFTENESAPAAKSTTGKWIWSSSRKWVFRKKANHDFHVRKEQSIYHTLPHHSYEIIITKTDTGNRKRKSIWIERREFSTQCFPTSFIWPTTL